MTTADTAGSSADTTTDATEASQETTVSSDTDAAATESTATSAPETSATEETNTALEVLNKIWAAYPADDKFSSFGGDMESAVMDAPGAVTLDAAALDRSLGFPQDSIDKISAGASLIHMLNTNTFTCGAYRVKDGEDGSACRSDPHKHSGAPLDVRLSRAPSHSDRRRHDDLDVRQQQPDRCVCRGGAVGIYRS